ncbi:hypothetical protein CJ010_10985 [Azoarcus sp. DD4]|uniref:hypothetical protein n=1 Tax=Azoarcus sp. DD4 TaxID=2027405 RepID=UPI00112C825D|nr:hypothetical protein [Azoarcus sp. DD4]QDF97014.1 hypothetical protein CJ010_10985 [Azoarcus sp. DD4]
MKRLSLVALLAAVLAASVPAAAHTDEYLEAVKAPHGGRLRMSGPYHLELVVKDRDILVYVTDHGDKEIATAGGEGKVVLQRGSSRVSVRLEPSGGNVLRGKSESGITPSTSAVVFVKLPGQDAYSARYPAPKPVDPQPAAHRGGAASQHDGHHMMHH